MFQTLLIGLFVLLVATVLYLRNQLASKRPKDNTIGFFHPYCNDGGGGERVLWCAVKSLQELNSSTKIVIFTGYDPNFTGDQIVARARERFNIAISRPVEFVFLKRRWLVEDKTYPRFTLLGQSLGSMLLCWEAINNVNPHVYIDTMGYAFTNLVVRLFTNAKIACYVHYPTISTDMLQVVQNQQNTFNNDVASSTLKTKVKLVYYKLFAAMYSFAGARSELVMVNSTWTKNHILDLWKIPKVTHRLYPPCNTSELKTIPLGTREKYIISIGQFRREKDHPLQIKAFHRFLQKYPQYQGQVKLALIGSIRNNEDQGRVDNLKSLAKELKVQDDVEFCINVPFPELKRWLSRAMIGVHTMWNEHFGIGVVEFMAAGVIPVAHNSAGPKEDIVIEYNKGLTGFLATTAEEFADGFERVLALSEKERRAIQENARESTDRFSDEAFAENFKGFMKPFLQ